MGLFSPNWTEIKYKESIFYFILGTAHVKTEKCLRYPI